MGTRTYSRRASDGSRKLTALGRRRIAEAVVKFSADDVAPSGVLYPLVEQLQALQGMWADISDEDFAESLVDFVLSGSFSSRKPPIFESYQTWLKEINDNALLMEIIANRRADDQQFDTTFPTSTALFADMRTNPDAYLQDMNGVPIVIGRMFPYDTWAQSYLQEVYRPKQAGFFGSGTYYMSNNTFAQDEKSPNPSLAQVVKRLTNSDISIYSLLSGEYLDDREIQATRSRMGAELPAVVVGGLKAGAVTNFSDIMGGMTNVNKRYTAWLTGLTDSFQKQFGFVVPNIGIMAAIMGYDAIAIPMGVAGVGGGHEIIVLNREAVRTSMETHVGFSGWQDSLKQAVGA